MRSHPSKMKEMEDPHGYWGPKEVIPIEEWIQEIEHCECCYDTPVNELIPFCYHIWCHGCVFQRYEMAVDDVTAFPVRCCEGDIPITDAVRDIIGAELADAYEAIYKERTDPNPMYCSKSSCSLYVPDVVVSDNSTVPCSACETITCVLCMAEAHLGACTEKDTTLTDMAEASGWKECPQCHNMVEQADGCWLLFCNCGVVWCFKCGNGFENCTCRQELPDRTLAPRISVRNDRT
ncbi:hypothetical protein N7474_002695 [Penicillium riverlandense]|uniref:uncharacterized protein n=1 Tax=Penicillium riverlandense TaxID=1903569 RepID=UPI00254706B8|nr:uncharacterized protein N7474_002695 [Penicillium riverlandense]KAJ5825557.1 hypothetical protein N7474_002695 [Penicillium riverlandense]